MLFSLKSSHCCYHLIEMEYIHTYYTYHHDIILESTYFYALFIYEKIIPAEFDQVRVILQM